MFSEGHEEFIQIDIEVQVNFRRTGKSSVTLGDQRLKLCFHFLNSIVTRPRERVRHIVFP
jgi:hypothetical protein